MDENTLKMEMKVFVLDNLVALLWAAHHKASHEGALASMAFIRTRMMKKAKAQTFPGLDPALADLAQAKFERRSREKLDAMSRIEVTTMTNQQPEHLRCSKDSEPLRLITWNDGRIFAVCPICGSVGEYEQVREKSAGLISGILSEEQRKHLIAQMRIVSEK